MMLRYYIAESARAKHGPELLAACAESRLMGTRPTDNADIKKLGGAHRIVRLARIRSSTNLLIARRLLFSELVHSPRERNKASSLI